MYKFSIQYGPAEPHDDGMVLPEAGKEMADIRVIFQRYRAGQKPLRGKSVGVC